MGRWMAELRKYTSGFQKEFGDLLAEPREQHIGPPGRAP